MLSWLEFKKYKRYAWHAVEQKLIDFQNRSSPKHESLEVQDQTKNSLWDDPYEGFPTTKGQSLVFGLPG